MVELLKKYQRNMDEIRSLDAKMYNTEDKKLWQEAMLERAKRISELYKENNEIVDAVNAYTFDQEPKRVLDEAISMYANNYDDAAILIPLFTKALSYLEKGGYYQSMMNLYLFLGYEDTEYVSRMVGGSRPDAKWYKKIFEMEERYDSLELPNKANYINGYYNYLTLVSDHKDSIEESYEYYKRLKHFLFDLHHMDEFMEDEYLRANAHDSLTAWLVSDDVIESAGKEIQEAFIREAEYWYLDEAKENGLSDVDSQVYRAYVHSLAMKKEISYQEAVERLMDYYRSQRDAALEESDFDFIIGVPISIEKLLCHTNKETEEAVMEELIRLVNDSWDEAARKKTETSFVNDSLAKWCTTTLKYRKSREEKEKSIIQLIVKRQLPTYLHSYMVSRLALAILDEVHSTKPELLLEIPYSYSEIKEFTENAALLHDIGKTRICDIVNMMRRKLSDFEFHGIRNHPSYGVGMLAEDKDLSLYTDVILGHHKFYNGQGGYPKDYDNTKSQVRLVTDLITLSDCLDAATDYLGRNYKNAKTCHDVFREFEADMGIRYNPDLVELILNSPRLQKAIEQITATDRIEYMYEAIQRMQK